jgi:hypothetical protein
VYSLGWDISPEIREGSDVSILRHGTATRNVRVNQICVRIAKCSGDDKLVSNQEIDGRVSQTAKCCLIE